MYSIIHMQVHYEEYDECSMLAYSDCIKWYLQGMCIYVCMYTCIWYNMISKIHFT